MNLLVQGVLAHLDVLDLALGGVIGKRFAKHRERAVLEPVFLDWGHMFVGLVEILVLRVV